MVKTTKGKLCFGIMCNGTRFPKWQAETITKLLANNNIECNLLIINNDRFSVPKYVLSKFHFNNIFWYFYSLYIELTSNASKQVDLTELLTSVPGIRCSTIKKGEYSEYFRSSDVLKIKTSNLDFILRFGFGIIRGEVLKSTKYGIWSFHHGDEKKYRGGPPCFWEIFHKDKITGSILQRLTNRLDAGIVLKKAYLKTNYSLRKNRDQVSFESSNWPVQVCVDILNNKTGCFNTPPSKTIAPILYSPTNLQFIKFLFIANFEKISQLFKIVFWADHWNIGVVEKPIQAFLQRDRNFTIKWFNRNLKNRYIADPFAIFENEQLYVFFEEFAYKKHKGHISYTYYKNGKFSRTVSIIKEPFHLSYPYLFKYRNNYYIIPESFEANKVILYKAIKFPFRWKREKILIDNFAGLDNTVFCHNNIWWLFSSNLHHNENSNLNLFYSDSLKGRWKRHPQNPVKVNVSSSRSAGTLFIHKGALYRPSMDCSEKYGGRITLNKVVNITKTEYREVEKTKIQPFYNSLYPDGVHNLS